MLVLNSGGGQSGNIVGMQSSIIQTHSFNVLQPGIDVVSFDGKFYNIYAPGLSFLSLPLATLGFISYGSMLGYVGNAAVMDEAFLAICAALTGLIVYKFARLYAGKYASLVSSVSLTLGSSVLPFAVSVFPHDCVMLSSCAGVYLIVQAAKGPTSEDRLLFLLEC